MRKTVLLCCALVALGSAAASTQTAAKPLSVYFIDVEGGQATLIVAPSGESMLVDTGFPGFDGRDAGRVLATAKQAGLTRIDYLVVTHYHADHVGNAGAIAAKIPIGTFVDHGASVEPGSKALYDAYVEARKSGRHLEAEPGRKIPIAGLDVTVVSAAGRTLATPLSGSAPNPLCAAFKPEEPDPGENAQSVGIVIDYGRFRMIDLGDLTWNKEHDLVCPDNRLGRASVYLTTHHGTASSGPPVIVHALHPRVAIMNNGTTKGGSPQAWTTVRSSPGLEDFWQLHRSTEGGADHNAPEAFIANLDESTAHGLTLSAQRDGTFTVTNTRTGQTKNYK